MTIRYRQFEGSVMIGLGVVLVMKIAAKKIKPMFSIFSVQFSSSIEEPGMIAIGGGGVCGWLGDENRNRKNQTDVFDF